MTTLLPTVSIIVPVYNVNEDYFARCIASIQNQTYKNIEVILIDDGSFNGCEKICDSLAANDAKFKTIHQKNCGVSEARNRGTVEAKGAYITYVDADDILSPFAIEEGVNCILSHNVDLVMAPVRAIRSYEDFIESAPISKEKYLFFDKSSRDIIIKQYLSEDVFMFLVEKDVTLSRGPYGKLIPSYIAKKVKFLKDLAIGEDVLWNIEMVKTCGKICYIPNSWYGYFRYDNSAINKFYGNREFISKKFLEALYINNKEYFQKHFEDYIKCLAIEFYCFLKYEMLSEKCNMNYWGKLERVDKCIKTYPWNLLLMRKNYLTLSWNFRLISFLAYFKLWQIVLIAKKVLLNLKKKLF